MRIDGAVAVDEHLIGQAHQEHARHDRDVRARLDQLERGPDRLRGRVRRARHHPVDHPQRDHQRPEVADVRDDVAGGVHRDALVRAAGGVLGREALDQLRVPGIEHVRAEQVQPEPARRAADLLLGAEQRQFHDAPAQQDVGRAQHALVGAFRQDGLSRPSLTRPGSWPSWLDYSAQSWPRCSRRQSKALVWSTGLGVVWVATIIACPLSGHHDAVGWQWYAELASSSSLLVLSLTGIRLLLRPRLSEVWARN